MRFDRIVGNDSEHQSVVTMAPKGRSTGTYGVILSGAPVIIYKEPRKSGVLLSTTIEC